MTSLAQTPGAGLLDDFFHGDCPDVDELSHDERLTLIADLEKLRGWVDATQARVIVEIHADATSVPVAHGDDDHTEFLADELALLLRISFPVARKRIETSLALCRRFEPMRQLIEDGRCSFWHGQRLTDGCARLDGDLASAVQARVLPRASSQTPAEFARAVRRAVLAVDPADRQQRRRAAAEDRVVTCRSMPDGMNVIEMLLPDLGAATVMAAAQAVADGYGASDLRTSGQRRADAITDICSAVLSGDLVGTGASQGRRAAIEVSVALSTLLGLDDQPGELRGHGPIPADVARSVACELSATWRTLITDDEGRLLDYGQRAYRPPAALRDFVIARDQTCRAPGCNRPARRCALDHRTPFDRGGPTAADNLDALCEHHHRMKHNGWATERTPDGTMRWTSPTGRRTAKPPDERPLDRTATLIVDDPAPF